MFSAKGKWRSKCLLPQHSISFWVKNNSFLLSQGDLLHCSPFLFALLVFLCLGCSFSYICLISDCAFVFQSKSCDQQDYSRVIFLFPSSLSLLLNFPVFFTSKCGDNSYRTEIALLACYNL